MSDEKASFVTLFRNRVVAGLFVVVPIGVSLWIGWFVFTKLTEWSVKLISTLFLFLQGHEFYGAETLAAFSVIVDNFWFITLVRLVSICIIIMGLFLVGEIAKWTVGKRLLYFTESLMMKVPMLNYVYSTIRQIGDALWSPHGGMFRQVVLFEYPRKGLYVIGFLTNENKSDFEIQKKVGKDLLSVFLPTTPNPTSGFLLFLPREDCVFLDMDVTEGMRLVISGGAVSPTSNLVSGGQFLQFKNASKTEPEASKKDSP